MQFTYCPDCGTKAVRKAIGDEGEMPYCPQCEKPLFEMFSTCVLSVAVNPDGKLLLIRQSYGQQTHYVGVAGYMKAGETAEAAAAREIAEEVGLHVTGLQFQFSAWHEARGQLMLCFRADVEESDCILSDEVREACWFSPVEAGNMVRAGSIIARLVDSILAHL